MSRVKLGSNAQFTGTSQSVSYVGDYCYAYSGVKSIDNNETTMCQFQTPKGIILAKVLFTYPDDTGTDDFRSRIYFNGQVVQSIIQGRVDYDFKFEYAIPLVIPPLTEVKLTMQNVQNTNARDQCVSFTGRVYA